MSRGVVGVGRPAAAAKRLDVAGAVVRGLLKVGRGAAKRELGVAGTGAVLNGVPESRLGTDVPNTVGVKPVEAGAVPAGIARPGVKVGAKPGADTGNGSGIGGVGAGERGCPYEGGV